MKYQIKIEDRVFDVEVQDINARPVIALVNGERIEVWPQESAPAISTTPPTLPKQASPHEKFPAGGAPSAVSTDQMKVLSPIPGTIVSISVQVGDSVAFGQELCVLEAMKMKNAIRATRSGQIGAVYVTVGQQVKHHDPLVEYAQ
ncbi:MAG: acetyl-CoA carboxylase biotin carboxyl carrier protein subunit [Chloroflexi bacterium]|nr:acetyl-CoA carboxylase biotin carboxyl carrier protein subunit [Chloroflexota bacterium]